MMRPSDKTLRRLGVSFITEVAGISEYRLNANSLKILLAPDPTSRVAAIVQHIHVGSRHEGAGNTGYSHLLEHELFKGTPKFNTGNGNSYDDFMKLMGGNYNATTSSDRTNYYAKVPSGYIRQYLEYEADRLRNAILTDEDLRTEMPVVVDEFDIGENDPDQVLFKQLSATMYTEHPYKVDTIGARSEVLKVTAAALKERLYDLYYWPNNTTVIVAGGFEIDRVLQDIVEVYGSIPSSPRPIPTPYTVEPAQFGERRYLINKPGDLPRVAIGFHVPEADHEDAYALAALALILGGTESSRLFNRLINTGRAADAQSWISPTHDPGQFIAYAKLTPGIKPASIERTMLREIEKLRTQLVSENELAQVKELASNESIHTRANRLNFALEISENEAVADWKWGQNYAANFDLVSRQDILRVAQKYLVADNRTVGYFIPTGQPAAPKPSEQKQGSTELISGDRRRLVVAHTPSQSGYATNVQRTVLPNGLTVLLLPSNTEAVGVNLVLNAGSHCAPSGKGILPYMVAKMLSSGSKKYSKSRLADFATRLGISLDVHSDTFKTVTNAEVPSRLPEYLDILADVVRHPRFKQDELDLLKITLNAQLEESAQDPDDQATIALLRALYAPSDRFYADTTAEQQAQVQSITVEELRNFHEVAYGPKGAVLTLVGKFDPNELLKLIERKFADWSGGVDRAAKLSNVEAVEKSQRIDRQIDGKDNLTILVGLPSGLTSTNNDYLAAALANKALGGDTLNSRLGIEIREKRGLTYGINCRFLENKFGGGPWVIRMTTNANNIDLALPLISKVVNNFASEGIGQSELASEKIGMSTAFDLQLDNPLDIAEALAAFEHSGQGLAAMDTYQTRLQALTKEQVDAATRKYFRVDEAITVVAGNLPTNAHE